MAMPTYEVLALKYAWRKARRADLFIGGDPHDADATMDYFLWVIRGNGRVLVVDTGFNQDMAVKRHRTLLRTPAEALRAVDVDPSKVENVIVTHFHNDHIGAFDSFPRATFHVQDDEIDFSTGRLMRHERFNRAVEPDHVCGLIRLVFDRKVAFHDGDSEIAPGITVHRIGGHTKGMQVVRIHTKRGWIVLASDASHYYEHFEKMRAFPLVYHVGELMEGFAKLVKLADSPKHVVPGHDPLVMGRYPPAGAGLEGFAVRLDENPKD